jgi:hypothetical protein
MPARDFFDDTRGAPMLVSSLSLLVDEEVELASLRESWTVGARALVLYSPLSRKTGGMVRTRLRHRFVSRSLGFLGNAASEGRHLSF